MSDHPPVSARILYLYEPDPQLCDNLLRLLRMDYAGWVVPCEVSLLIRPFGNCAMAINADRLPASVWESLCARLFTGWAQAVDARVTFYGVSIPAEIGRMLKQCGVRVVAAPDQLSAAMFQ